MFFRDLMLRLDMITRTCLYFIETLFGEFLISVALNVIVIIIIIIIIIRNERH